MKFIVTEEQFNFMNQALSESNVHKIEPPIEDVKIFEKLLNRYMPTETDWWKMVKLESIKLFPIGLRGYSMHLVGHLIVDGDWAYDSAKDVGTNITNIIQPDYDEYENDGITLGDIITEKQGNEIREILLPFATTFFSKNIIYASFGGLKISI